MGILSINRNLLSKFKPKSLSSSSSPDICFFRRIFSPAAVPPQQQAHHDPIVVADMKLNYSKSMFLIDHVHKGITSCSQLSAAPAPENNNSWKVHHRLIGSPFSGRPGKYLLVGSCKEWTLFWPYEEEEEEDSNQFGEDYHGNSFYQYHRRLSLWNPTTKCIKTLPPSLLPRPFPTVAVDIECFGFGFDFKSQDYKLVCFLAYDYLNGNDSWGIPYIELYSLKTDEWKQITPSHYVASPTTSFNSIHINGVYYWSSTFILSFDFADEDFSEIPLPHDSVRMSNDFCLAEFHGSLAIILPYLVPTEDLTEEEKQKQLQQPFSIKIWVWNGETWNLAPRVAVGDFPRGDKIARAMGLFQDEYLFLQGCAEPELMLFNCKTGKLEKLGIHHDALESTTPSLRKPSVFPYTVPI